MPYPASPWAMHGQAWGSVFLVRRARDRPDGLYAAAWVRYDEPSPLTYHELLVVRVRRGRSGRTLTITDIWVDSPDSLEGGRALWAIPKELSDFTSESTRRGPWRRTTWHAATADGGIASARFHQLSLPVPALPFSGGTRQPPLADGRTSAEATAVRAGEVTATLNGRGRPQPAHASWWFAADGPLAWLQGQRQLGSGRLAGFEMTLT